MLFDDALSECRPGEYVNSVRSGWNEYHVQYGRNDKGELFWTAGNTVGGPLGPKHYADARKRDGDYAIYSWFGSHIPRRQ